MKQRNLIHFIKSGAVGIMLSMVVLTACKSTADQPVDKVWVNGLVWTGLEDEPRQGWIAINGDRIHSTGFEDSPPAAKETIDLSGRLVLPGFNDSHVHFASAGALLLGVNLLDVNSDEGLVDRLMETTRRLPTGSWITRGDWGAYEAWEMGSEGGDTRQQVWEPNRQLIDEITTDHPVLITRYDRSVGLANGLALEFLQIESETGILKGEDLQDALRRIPAKSFEQKVAEAKRALEECARWGVTTVQDMSPLDQVDVYEHLLERGELSTRINFAPSRLSDYKMMAEKGWTIDWDNEDGPASVGNDYITFGTIKSHIDGIMGGRTARFFEPYSDNSVEMVEWRGGWREFSRDLGQFKKMLIDADKEGIQLRVHAIGDEANSILLDILDTLDEVNGARDRRFRLVHAQVISEGGFERFAGRNIVAEVQPYHVTDDMRWMEERIGYERCRGAYAFKTLEEKGCILSFGSDWPGTNASYYPVNPLFGLYAAVTRQTVQGKPDEGWFPEQRIDLATSLKAYTWGSSFGAFEEKVKGTIEPGKFADFAILQENIFETDPADWLSTEVYQTIVGGKVVYAND